LKKQPVVLQRGCFCFQSFLQGQELNFTFLSMSVSEKSIYREQRAAVRHKITLNRSVLVTATGNSANSEESYYALQAQLLDVSLSGLALVISAADAQRLQQLGEDLMIHLLLPLPVKAIELEVSPVRYQTFGEAEKVLMGVYITDMKGSDRVIFMEFINDYETP
jgi:c-di-GMP-binding flagellar brake protein YcgR